MCTCLCIQQPQQGHVGVSGPLVDNNGYPRNDIDVYAVRTARNRVISEHQCGIELWGDTVCHRITE